MRQLRWSLMLVIGCTCGFAWGQIVPVGDVMELFVGYPETAIDAAVAVNGDFGVVTCRDLGDHDVVVLDLFTADGTPISDELQVAELEPEHYCDTWAVIARNDNEGFVVAWSEGYWDSVYDVSMVDAAVRSVAPQGVMGDAVPVITRLFDENHISIRLEALSDNGFIFAFKYVLFYVPEDRVVAIHYDSELIPETPWVSLDNSPDYSVDLLSITKDGAGGVVSATRHGWPYAKVNLRRTDLDLNPLSAANVSTRLGAVLAQPAGATVLVFRRQTALYIQARSTDFRSIAFDCAATARIEAGVYVVDTEAAANGSFLVGWTATDRDSGDRTLWGQLFDPWLLPVADSVSLADLDDWFSGSSVILRTTPDGHSLGVWNAPGGEVRARRFGTSSQPVAWWRAEGDTSDTGANGNDGTASGGLGFVSGPCGQALTFDGTDGLVAVPDDPSLDLGTGDFTINYWVRTTDSGGTKVVLDKREPGVIQGYHAFLLDGRPGVQLADDQPGSDNFVASRSVADGRWHLVTIAVDRDQPDGLSIQVDLLPPEVFDPTVRPGPLTSGAALTLGRRSAGFPTEGWFEGELDEVRITSWAASSIYPTALYASCQQLLFHDGFETGDIYSWTESEP